jgi:site-specific DNA-methyltransferase (adenine-specific)
MKPTVIGNATLYQGDCLDILPTLGKVDHVICDPPYEAITQGKWGVLSGVEYRDFNTNGLSFQAIDEIRQPTAEAISRACQGWAIIFCQAEGVRAWRDSFIPTKAKYKRAMVWVKPDAMPQFNGQGPSVGFENMVALWCGEGKSRWNGGGRPGVFNHCKNSGGKHEHPTQKPFPLMAELVSLFSQDDHLIADPFMGSGTTGVACAKLGRKFIGIELEPKYFDIACKRIEDAYKQPDFFVEPPPKAVQDVLL